MTRDFHDVENWVLGEVLRYQAGALVDKRCIEIDGGASLTYAQANHQANQIARFLAALGVAPGDRVAVFLPNSLAYCQAWFGIAKAGAVLGSNNPE